MLHCIVPIYGFYSKCEKCYVQDVILNLEFYREVLFDYYYFVDMRRF